MELLFPLLLVALLVPMFLGVRRQKREAEKVASMQEALKIGDRVTTTSGLYGTVVDADETTIDLEIAEDVVTTWLRASVRDVRTDDTTDTTDTTASTEVVDAPESTVLPQPADDSEAAAGATAPSSEESVEETTSRLSKD